MPKKFLLLIHGPMGSGKTTLANVLHEKLKPSALVGLDRIKWFVSGFKRTTANNAMTRAVVFAVVNEYLRQGVSVIIEQALKPTEVSALKRLAKKHKAVFFMYQLKAPREI